MSAALCFYNSSIFPGWAHGEDKLDSSLLCHQAPAMALYLFSVSGCAGFICEINVTIKWNFPFWEKKKKKKGVWRLEVGTLLPHDDSRAQQEKDWLLFFPGKRPVNRRQPQLRQWQATILQTLNPSNVLFVYYSTSTPYFTLLKITPLLCKRTWR